MADLNQAEKDVEAADGALEKRVTAHEENLKTISDDLQKQIDALRASGDASGVTASLVALKSKIDGFDADAAQPVPAAAPAQPAPEPAPQAPAAGGGGIPPA